MKTDGPLESLAAFLLQHHLTLSIAEGMTGGLLGHLLTSVPGASRYYLGSIITYSVESRGTVLRIENRITETYGTVSKESVIEMAEKVKTKFGSDVGLAISGIAGPDGGSIAKPIGFVWVSVAYGNINHSVEFRIGPDHSRGYVQRDACIRAAGFAVEALESLV